MTIIFSVGFICDDESDKDTNVAVCPAERKGPKIIKTKLSV